jgi:hypothetical protein
MLRPGILVRSIPKMSVDFGWMALDKELPPGLRLRLGFAIGHTSSGH